MKNKPYYILLGRDHKSHLWGAAFGDYTKKSCLDEKRSQKGVYKHFTIVKAVSDTPWDFMTAVNEANKQVALKNNE